MRLLILILATAQLVCSRRTRLAATCGYLFYRRSRLSYRTARRRRSVPLVFRWSHRSLGSSRRRRCGYPISC